MTPSASLRRVHHLTTPQRLRIKWELPVMPA